MEVIEDLPEDPTPYAPRSFAEDAAGTFDDAAGASPVVEAEVMDGAMGGKEASTR